MAKPMTPNEFAADMRRLCADLSGHELHRAADDLMCRFATEQGGGEGVGVFLEAIADYHAVPAMARVEIVRAAQDAVALEGRG